MLFARIRRHKWLNSRQLAWSQGVVCKIRQPPLLVPQALLLAIPFHPPRVVLTVFLPIRRVRLAPLPRTLQANQLVHRIGSDLLPMVIGAALPLACRLVANLLLRMITVRLKSLPTVTATVALHPAAPKENGSDSFSLEAPLPTRSSQSTAAGCFSLPASTAGVTSEFERRVRALQRPYDYAV
jgi:hypothetical protein